MTFTLYSDDLPTAVTVTIPSGANCATILTNVLISSCSNIAVLVTPSSSSIAGASCAIRFS